MAHDPKKDLFEKQKANFDELKERSVIIWVNAIIGESFLPGGPAKFHSQFKDGKALVRLVNIIVPESLSEFDMNLKVNTANDAVYSSRISAYNRALRKNFFKFEQHLTINESGMVSGMDVCTPLDHIYLFGVMCNERNIRTGRGGILPTSEIASLFKDDENDTFTSSKTTITTTTKTSTHKTDPETEKKAQNAATNFFQNMDMGMDMGMDMDMDMGMGMGMNMDMGMGIGMDLNTGMDEQQQEEEEEEEEQEEEY